jgi:hypothetical protein
MGTTETVDAVLRKCAGVLGQAELCEPIGYFLHRRYDCQYSSQRGAAPVQRLDRRYIRDQPCWLLMISAVSAIPMTLFSRWFCKDFLRAQA